MNKLLSKFLDWVGGVRTTDPETSQSASKINRKPLVERVYDIMYRNQWGWTGKDLARELGVPLNSVTPRLAPLRRQGRIKDSGESKDGQILWVVTR